ncbi:C40 family peptidase [Alicyclobacillus sp. SO9]|uniref:C40 family peptidase n=1 Tax=Alicyclobacillus sp. SO9 TaxID=2665646 RepID=UPI0018E72B96|nr:C40 family peptidase [Alicyclobacillus sp. SO9]QQE79924.1 C40 family peptidase [Alicyclobacillus sp. SO9]
MGLTILKQNRHGCDKCMPNGRSSRWKMALSVGSLLTLSGFFIPHANASSLSQKKQQLQNLKNQASQNSAQLSKDQHQKSQFKQQIQAYSDSIQNLKASISTNQNQMSSLKQQIQQMNDKINKTQSQLQTDQNNVAQMIRASYEDGNVSFLQVLFKSTSWSDFLNRLNDLAEVTKAQKALVNQVTTLKKQLEQEQQQKQSSYQHLSSRNAQLAVLVQVDAQLVKKKNQAMKQVTHDAQVRTQQAGVLESQIHLTKSEVAALQAQTIRDEAKMKSKSYLTQAKQSLGNANTSALISFAERFEGRPYVWGGTSPYPGFDCSGFTQYVYGHFGINLPRTSGAQFGVGLPVSRNNLKPGDLVFFSTYAPGASHVGIYIGGDQMIDSEDSGLMVTNLFSNPYWSARYIGARDVIRH